MAITPLWSAYEKTYRAREIKTLTGWISAGESGSVVGLNGCGRTNLLGFLCHRPDVIQTYLSSRVKQVALIPVDLNNLPANDLSTLYRTILRSFYRVGDQFSQALRQKITDFYQETRAQQDPFLAQSALQDLLLVFQAEQFNVVLVLNRFDNFCQMASPPMVNTLRGLRDDFKDTLCYIVGMAQAVAYLPDPTILGEMYELLDNYVCWVGAMNEEDGRNLISRATSTAITPPSETDITTMLELAGYFPALLRAMCQWWLTTKDKPPHSEWGTTLLTELSIHHRLRKMWGGLTQEEQFILAELQKLQFVTKKQNFARRHQPILSHLAEKGVCSQSETDWRVAGGLLASFVAEVKGRGRGRIWLDEQTEEIYQGQTLVQNLTALEQEVLTFLVKHPRLRHTKTDLIINTWPDELRQQGVTDNSLYQVISTIRREIEPNLTDPSYLINWRGKPEGGYQFFPEGRPG